MANLTEKLANIWKKIKNQPKDIWFFYLFLLTFTLGVRKVILFFPIKRAFNEYTGVYVYASDIFLWLAILVWIISILYNKISNLSSSREAISDFIHRKDTYKKDEFSVSHKLSTDKISFNEAVFGLFDRIRVTWKEQVVPRGTIWQARFWAMFHSEKSNNVPRGTFLNHGAGVERFACSLPRVLLHFHSIMFGFLFIMLFDHYFWDIWQGQVLFWLASGLLVGTGLIDFSKNCSTWNNLKLIESKECSTWNILSQCIFVIPLFLVIWSFISVVWSENQLIGLYRSFRFMELYLLFIYISLRFVPYLVSYLLNCSTWNNSVIDNSTIVPRGTIAIENRLEASNNIINNVPRGTFYPLIILLGIIIFLGVAQSLLGIAQFIAQHSLGLFWLKESLIGPDITGVAKIIINYQPFIRAYGLFPHPNILGGFLFFSITVTLLYKKLFHVEQFGNQNIDNCSTLLRRGFGGQAWKNLNENSQASKIVPRGTFWLSLKEKVLNMGNFINLILLIQIFGIIVSFSKSAILALGVAWVYVIVPRGTFSYLRGTRKFDGLDLKNNGESDFPNCSTWNIIFGKVLKLFHVEQFRVGIIKIALFVGFLLLVFVSLGYFKFDFQAFFLKSLEERNLYLSVSERIISSSPMVGVGTGQFIFEMERFLPNLKISQYQPVHNIFLLIWSEWGIVGLVLFIVFLWKLFHACLPEPRRR